MGKKIVAITACTTGIAHTYMAAEKLQKTGTQLGYEIKVETQGASGAKNILTAEEIAEADGIILAIDKGIDESRFAGREVYRVKAAGAIKEPQKVIENAVGKIGTEKLAGTAVQTGQASKPANGEKGIKGAYKHVMAGVSYMLPVVVAGGILTALSFAFGVYAYEEEGTLAWALHLIGASGALGIMIPVFSAYIAHSIANRSGFAAGIVGGWVANSIGAGFIGGILAGFLAGYVTLLIVEKLSMPKSLQGVKDILVVPILSTGIVGLVMVFVLGKPIQAVTAALAGFLTSLSGGSIILLGVIFGLLYWDLGGPISKVVYTFAVGLLAEGVYAPMAAAMVCGMVPPIGIALATLLKPKLWTAEQREAGKAALFLGFSFITEGAIPFAAEDPKVILPACMAGSAVGSIVSLMMGAQIVAPHGGLFLLVIPNAIANVGGFLLALTAGAAVTMLLTLLLKTLDLKKKGRK